MWRHGTSHASLISNRMRKSVSQVAAALCTSEGEEGERDRDGKVDADLADVNFVLILARSRAALREDRATVAVRVAASEQRG